MDAAAKARRDYMRAWRAANKDKVKEHNRRYWERRAAKMAEKEGKSGGRCFDSQSDGTKGEE